jgi:hypothetical protein
MPLEQIAEHHGDMPTLAAILVARAGKAAGIEFKVHPHMLQHAFGFKLANDGHDTRSHRRTWATKTFSTRCAILSYRRRASRTSGGEPDFSPAYPECCYHSLICAGVGGWAPRSPFGMMRT